MARDEDMAAGVKDMSHGQFLDWAMDYLMCRLFEGGGNAMRAGMSVVLVQHRIWMEAEINRRRKEIDS